MQVPGLSPALDSDHFTPRPQPLSRETGSSLSSPPDPLIPFQSAAPDSNNVADSKSYFDLPKDAAPLSTPVMSVHSPLPTPSSNAATTAALTAMQYLPVPVIVLSAAKMVIMANDSFARLIGIDVPVLAEDGVTPLSITDILWGRTIADLGIDLLQHGSPILVAWEELFDSLFKQDAPAAPALGGTSPNAVSPSHRESPVPLTPSNLARTTVRDVAVDVLITNHSDILERGAQSVPVQAGMIISSWSIDDVQHYTLTFTSSSPSAPSTPSQTRSTSRTVTRASTQYAKPSTSTSSVGSNGRRSVITASPTSTISTPNYHTPLFPPHGPPHKNDRPAMASIYQKATQLKDAIMNSIHMPAYAMWKDESFGIPNKALLALLPDELTIDPKDQREFLSLFHVWTEDFTRELTVEELPIMEICRSQKRFENRRVGMKNPKTGASIIFEVTGEPIEANGEFLGGIVTFKDVTEYTREIAAQIKKNEKQFEYIANHIPIMLWTTDAKGSHDWYSQRWYDYTGLSEEESLGEGWRNAFCSEDMAATEARWFHSLATGDEYITEYRCKRYDGEYRWMLGRAVPFRDENGKIIKFFGTCIDIHDLVTARMEAKASRQQLLRVIEHARVTLWAINKDRKITLMEGNLVWQGRGGPWKEEKPVIGENIYDLTRKHRGEKDMLQLRSKLERVLQAQSQDETVEMHLDGDDRWFRTRMVPLFSTTRNAGVEGKAYIDGAIGVSMDVTELRERDQELKEQEEANSRLLANAVAAKEASRMKSQFLANMSHEIRTPIAGVIGMSELLLDTNLNEEQRECADNIQRSANALLTVINDILDLSKVESGRLDVEEVQFSLSIVLNDVNKMMSFAAQRKNIAYESYIEPLIANDLRVMGDPGRLRQILTNILTNSIKFTSEGTVRLVVSITHQTDESVSVQFVVQDTGIGIEEEVRKRLFKPFSQADSSTARRFGGTGLGLTISKNLVELMHGDIDLQSKLGVGTKTTFTIPFNRAQYQEEDSPLVALGSIPDRLQSDVSISCGSAEETTPPSTPNAPNNAIRRSHSRVSSVSMPSAAGGIYTPISEALLALPENERQKIQVLVVEDNPINQQIAIKTIRKLKFSVNAVWNGQEALDYLQNASASGRPLPDIVLMDVQMPVLDGYDATKRIRQSDNAAVRGVHIIAMTASAIQGDKEKCQQAGMDDYLPKPVRAKVLEKMLLKWATEGRRKSTSTTKSRMQMQMRGPEEPQLPSELIAALPSLNSGKRPDKKPEWEEPFHLHPDRTARRRSSSAHPDLDSVSTRLGRIQFEQAAALARSSETDNDRLLRHVRAEERASDLRDAKLFSVVEDPRELHLTHGGGVDRVGGPSHQLTRENIDRFERSEIKGILVGVNHSMTPQDRSDFGSPVPRLRNESLGSLVNNISGSVGRSTPSDATAATAATPTTDAPLGGIVVPLPLSMHRRPNLAELRGYDSAPIVTPPPPIEDDGEGTVKPDQESPLL